MDNLNLQPLHTENQGKKFKSQADPTCKNFIIATHKVTQWCVWPLHTSMPGPRLAYVPRQCPLSDVGCTDA